MSSQRIVVTNASPVIHLARADHLDILLELYDKIYCAEAAADDIRYPQEAVDFVKEFTTVQPITDTALVAAIQKAHPKLALGEIQTYVLYTEICAEEMLFLNTRAQNIFKQEYNGNVRDLVFLPMRDVKRTTFRDDAELNDFYKALAKVIPAYKPLVDIIKARGLT